MIDLYARIGVSSEASDSEIRNQLNTIEQEQLKRQVAFVLLNKNRRKVYDRCYWELKKVGMLRSSFHLNNTPFWSRQD
jgi:hypothetical protein